jgi:hypothetical protein
MAPARRPQRYVAAIRLFGDAAAKQTADAKSKGQIEGGIKRHSSSVLISAQSSTPNETGDRWHQLVARNANAAGLDITPSGIRAMKEVMPGTQQNRPKSGLRIGN